MEEVELVILDVFFFKISLSIFGVELVSCSFVSVFNGKGVKLKVGV